MQASQKSPIVEVEKQKGGESTKDNFKRLIELY
jgi:hypothetical protein